METCQKAIHETPYDSRDVFWIGYGNSIGHHANDQAKKLNPKSFDEIKAEITDFLQPWIVTGFITLDETTFGIWNIIGIN